MSRARLPIVPHLPPEEIARRYRAGRGGVEKAHWQALWRLTRADPPPGPARVAAQAGLTPVWIRALLKRRNAEGPAGSADRRAVANGGQSKLSAEQQAALFEALQGRPDDGGLWTGPKVAAYVGDRRGVAVGKQTGWEWLRGLGFGRRVPRPKDPGAATQEQRRAWRRGHGSVGSRAAPPVPRQDDRGVGRG
jgi:transposase